MMQMRIENYFPPDPAAVDLPLLNRPLHWYDDPSLVPDNLSSLNETIDNADGYIIVTPEYNRNAPPALINLLDHLPIRR